MRELFLNLREPSNAALRDSIVTGNTSAKDLVNFTQEVRESASRVSVIATHSNLGEQELASETIKAEQAAIDKQNLFAAQAAGATEVSIPARNVPVLSAEVLTPSNLSCLSCRPKRMPSSAANVVNTRRGTTRCRPDQPMNR